MNRTTPEAAGISSAKIKEYIDLLEENRLSTHSLIIMRGDNIVFEKYWEPFHADFPHRMYSISKSIVGIAVGFAAQDGYLNLDDPISKYFPEEAALADCDAMREQTIRHMLMMSTAKPERGWFRDRPKDIVEHYFTNTYPEHRPSGTIYTYDSEGSTVLGCLVEKLVGKPFMDYLHEKFLDKIGVTPEAHCLKCPGGWSWGESAVICTPMDMLKIAKFMMQKGKWNGEQILNEQYATEATSRMIDNTVDNTVTYKAHGYGYLIWRTHDNSFFFNGMGCQFAIGIPDKDMVVMYNADNQGHDGAQATIIDNLFRLVVRTAQDEPLPENPEALAELEKPLKLMTAKGETYVPFQSKINGVTFDLEPNQNGMTKFSLHFDENGKNFFRYTNAQGDKEIEFGMCENKFGIFPQTGYSKDVGGEGCPGHTYKCATSAAWTEPQKLFIKVQVIDTYFGRLNIMLGFRDENTVGVRMSKVAEDFMTEYRGYMTGHRAK